ncbi:hypothetical protein EC957_007173 [Mortierella hygrophila]|uniref:Yeast cell wall synthesis Kre9/Knh1-like N-terminal domain-containing protein n=1 Tax=Mortierella hygrophila TaxID=979708 RepID=A0A9P6FDT8_9FUNG|nr:hypothetical protein EC957_007173 [Mortierella hygrophila]
MKITSVSAVLCLVASAMAASIPQPAVDAASAEVSINMDKRAASSDKKAHSEHDAEAHKGTSKKSATTDKKDEKNAAEAKDDKDEKAEAPAAAVPGGAVAPDPHAIVPKEYESPLWLVQPYAQSVWAQATTYVISWGPNPDPDYAKNIEPKSPVEIRLMQGAPDKLKPVETLVKKTDSSKNSYQWLVPATLAPGKDYTIRITQDGKLDTYSHYFEVVPAGDKRASKSNVGAPLEMPRKGDNPKPLNKGPIIQPAAPPNPFPADKPAATPVANNSSSPSKPAAAKPVVNRAATSHEQNANIMAFAMTLFGAVYFL